MPRPAIEQADFRATAETLAYHDGQPYYIRTCHELVDGKWEGFVAMRRVKP